jgi:hypothetical protein
VEYVSYSKNKLFVPIDANKQKFFRIQITSGLFRGISYSTMMRATMFFAKETASSFAKQEKQAPGDSPVTKIYVASQTNNFAPPLQPKGRL